MMTKLAKGLIFASFVALVVGVPVLLQAANIDKYFQVTNVPVNDVLNIRAWPSHKSKKVGEIPRRQDCVWVSRSISKKGKKWYKVNFLGVDGWVNARYMARDYGCE